MSLPRRAALRWHHLTIDPVTFNLPLVELSDAYFLRLISTFWSSQRLPLCPYNSLALFKLLCFCFISTSLCLKCFACTNCTMLSLIEILLLGMVYQRTPYWLSVLTSFVWFFVRTVSLASKYRLQLSLFSLSLKLFYSVVKVDLVRW